MWMLASPLLLSAVLDAPAFAQDDLAPALVVKGKVEWEPKGKALEVYSRGDTKRGQQAWADAVPLLVEALQAQPGCGKCLQSLGRALTGGKRYADAVTVGDQLAKLYPDRKEGPYVSANALTLNRDFERAVVAWDAYLAIDKASVYSWNERNLVLLREGKFDEASKRLDAPAAGLSDKDVGCFRTEIALAKGDLAAADEAMKLCDESTDADLERSVGGWLQLQHGHLAEGQTKLASGGAEADTRLALALGRLSEGKFDAAANLGVKLIADYPWAKDVQLANARALAGLQKTDEAIAALDASLTGPGWETAQLALGPKDVALFLASPTLPKQVAVEALALKAALLERKGDVAGAQALREAGLKVHGDTALLKPPAPEAAPAPVKP